MLEGRYGEQRSIILFKEKQDCCGCEACLNVCPQNAITMKPDEYGFIYPCIDEQLCVGCGKCTKICAFKNIEENVGAQQVYAATAKDEGLLMKSASGGVFAVIAASLLRRGGKVYGCAMDMVEGRITPRHVRVESIDNLLRLQGSKYVQSAIGDTYKQVAADLAAGYEVLFSGTPCQVAALKSYLGNQCTKMLYTIDIICHGLPSLAFFHDYIRQLENKMHRYVVCFKFRDKSAGWGHMGMVQTQKHSEGTIKEKKLPVKLSSYYKLFLGSVTCRDSCYACKYASSHRPGDLTIGDFWGIQNEHADYLVKNGGDMDAQKGISCVLVNTEQGKQILAKNDITLNMKPSTFIKVSNENEQLKQASIKSNMRDHVLEIYKIGGYEAVETWYNKQLGLRRYLYQIWYMLPHQIQNMVKGIRSHIGFLGKTS